MGTHGIPPAPPGRRSGPGLLVVAGAGLIGSRLADLARDSGIRRESLTARAMVSRRSTARAF